MTKLTLNLINAIAETVSVCGLIFGNTYVRIACGFALIGYKWAKVGISYKQLKNKN